MCVYIDFDDYNFHLLVLQYLLGTLQAIGQNQNNNNNNTVGRELHSFGEQASSSSKKAVSSEVIEYNRGEFPAKLPEAKNKTLAPKTTPQDSS